MCHPNKVFTGVQDDLLQLRGRELVAHGPLLAVVVDERDLADGPITPDLNFLEAVRSHLFPFSKYNESQLMQY